MWQGRPDAAHAADTAALVPAEVLALISVFPADSRDAEDDAVGNPAVTQVAWDGRHSLAVASAGELAVLSLAGLRERLAVLDHCQVPASGMN